MKNSVKQKSFYVGANDSRRGSISGHQISVEWHESASRRARVFKVYVDTKLSWVHKANEHEEKLCFFAGVFIGITVRLGAAETSSVGKLFSEHL